MSVIKITFIGDFLYNSGSGQTIIEYSKVAKRQGVQLSISGFIDKFMARNVPVLDRVSNYNTDVVIFLFENIMYLDPQKFPGRLESYLKDSDKIPRIVIDTDAKYKSIGKISEESMLREEIDDLKTWDLVIDNLTNIILQPKTQSRRKHMNTYPFLFFAFPNIVNSSVKKVYDVTYLGNNWNRENEMTAFLHSAIDSKCINSVRINGKNWRKKEIESRLLNKSNVKNIPFKLSIRGSVLPNTHLKFMSKGLINPILVNKDLLEKYLVTPRMFEAFAANTIPLLTDSALYVKKIYSEQSNIFFSPEEMIGRKIKDIFSFYKKYEEKRNEIRKHLKAEHSFEKRFTELLGIINNLS